MAAKADGLQQRNRRPSRPALIYKGSQLRPGQRPATTQCGAKSIKVTPPSCASSKEREAAAEGDQEAAKRSGPCRAGVQCGGG